MKAQMQSHWTRVEEMDTYTPIDPHQYATLLRSFGKHMDALIAKYKSQSRLMLNGLQYSVLSNNPELIRRYANTLKGSSTSVAAAGLARLCGQVEQSAKNKLMENVPEMVEKIHREYNDVIAALNELASHASNT